MSDLTALTDDEGATLDYLSAAFDAGAVALVRTQLDGVDRAAIAIVTLNLDDGESFDITPVALLIDGDTFARLTNPAEEVDA